MLGRDGAWYYGYPCGETSRLMRKSGRMRGRKTITREINEQLRPDLLAELGYDLTEQMKNEEGH